MKQDTFTTIIAWTFVSLIIGGFLIGVSSLSSPDTYYHNRCSVVGLSTNCN